jgi:pyridinium-3,5-biscarboxylic acid mononucleotide synthase
VLEPGTAWQDTQVDHDDLGRLLHAVADGTVTPQAAAERLHRLPFADLGFARVDHHRTLRQGQPEAVYGPGKTPTQCSAIVGELLAGSSGPVVLTRADRAQVDAALHVHPGGLAHGDPDAPHHTVVWRPVPPERPDVVWVVTAGTADLPVAEECAAVLGALGIPTRRLTDCGVAGIHRLLPHTDDLAAADAVVVVAGMEGALASVIGGITPAPVVAVPTSVGYGAALEGITALLAMLSSCAQGVTVVGIDNGFGAACAVARLCGRRASRA